jgi:sec-independent protein translocase protein TatC
VRRARRTSPPRARTFPERRRGARLSRLRPIGHEDRLSLVEHLDELRNRLIVSLLVLGAAFAVCYWQNAWLLDTINKPLQSTQSVSNSHHKQSPLEDTAAYGLKTARAQRLTLPALAGQKLVNDLLASKLKLSPAERTLLRQQDRQLDAALRATRDAAASAPRNTRRLPVTLGVTEPFVTTFTVAGYAALLLALPFLLYQAYAFVLPAFSPNERQIALPLMAMVPFLFVAGVVFAYYMVLPNAINFLQNFNDDNFDILLQARDYYKFSIMVLAAMGLLFQVPIGILAITRVGIVTPRQLRKNRRYAILVIAIVAMLLPGQDPVTMCLLMAPLIVLFEGSILLAALVDRRAARARAREEAELADSNDDDFSHDHDLDD